jgi:hypothetical protein
MISSKAIRNIFLLSSLVLLTLTATAETEQVVFDTVGSHNWNVPENVDEATILVVGGGGGGGQGEGGGGGGGGAGGLAYAANYTLTKDDYTIVVGDGGAGADLFNTEGEAGQKGEDSYFGNVVAYGGGGGAAANTDTDATNGGSGGGSADQDGARGYATQPGTNDGFQDYGHDGGGWNSNELGAGGGGAGEAGEADDGSESGDGGDGRYYGDVFSEEYGENGWFAGGGGGATDDGNGDRGWGGKGGGGRGAGDDGGNTAGQDGTGGGGGAGSDPDPGGEQGGSGIVIIKYRTGASICDRRGAQEECISNSTHNVDNQHFNISSLFQSESTAEFNSLTGTATINVTNTTRISGLWRGGFEIFSERTIIRPGADFRPEENRIILGK